MFLGPFGYHHTQFFLMSHWRQVHVVFPSPPFIKCLFTPGWLRAPRFAQPGTTLRIYFFHTFRDLPEVPTSFWQHPPFSIRPPCISLIAFLSRVRSTRFCLVGKFANFFSEKGMSHSLELTIFSRGPLSDHEFDDVKISSDEISYLSFVSLAKVSDLAIISARKFNQLK